MSEFHFIRTLARNGDHNLKISIPVELAASAGLKLNDQVAIYPVRHGFLVKPEGA